MPTIKAGFGDLAGFELTVRAAKAIAASTLVPPQFQNNLPNCIIALEMANRIGASPLMVVQNLYVVYGRPGWSAKFLIASFNQCGRFSAIRYEWQGKQGEDAWGCRATAIEKATGEKISGPLITIALAKAEGWFGKKGSKWETIPELMLCYRAAAWMVNTHAPEISMGLNTAEEVSDVYDAMPDASGKFTVTTDELRREPEPGTTIDQSTGEIKPDSDPKPEASNGGAKPEAGNGAPAVDYEKLLTKLQTRQTVDELDSAATLIGEVGDFDRRNTLTDAYTKRRSELVAPKGKK
jgi:hypothetical protein